jgi:hypothetical protein
MRYFIGVPSFRTISTQKFKMAEDTYLLLFRLSSETIGDKFVTIGIVSIARPLILGMPPLGIYPPLQQLQRFAFWNENGGG